MVEVIEEVVRDGPTPERRVSCIPGAEGAPRVWDCRWECVLECPAAGVILIAWREVRYTQMKAASTSHEEVMGR